MPICYRVLEHQAGASAAGPVLQVKCTTHPYGTSLDRLLAASFPGLSLRKREEDTGGLLWLSTSAAFDLCGEVPTQQDIDSLLVLLRDCMTVCDDCDISHCLDLYRTPRETAERPEEWPYTTTGRLVYRAKYRGDEQAAAELGELMEGFVRQHVGLQRAAAVCAVPRSSERVTGPDLPPQWARHLSRWLGVPVLPLVRARYVRTQKAFEDLDQRRQNQAGSMRAGPQARGLSVMAIDDFYTEGDTMREAGRALRESGATAVYGLCAVKTAKGTRGFPF